MRWSILAFLVACGGGPSEEAPIEACNGHAELCDRPLDEVVFPRDHNAHAAEELGYIVGISANHFPAIPGQLALGVRAVNMDIYGWEDGVWFCHGFCELGRQPADEGLAQIRDFLEHNPHEVLILDFQDELGPEGVLAALEDAGLDRWAHTQVPGDPWPTLREMIEDDRRLVVIAPGRLVPWIHPWGDLAWGNPTQADTPEDLERCEVDGERGEHKLFLLNAVLTSPLASPSLAEQVNHRDFLLPYAQECSAKLGVVPNLMTVDYSTIGDLVEVVDALNGL